MSPVPLVCARCGFATPARPGAARVDCDRCGHRLDQPCDCARCEYEPSPPTKEEMRDALDRLQEDR